VKGYEVSKNEYVVVEDEDLKKMAPVTAETIDVLQFVRETEVDPIYFERSYYVAPGDNVDKPYNLFFKALKETKYSALAKVSMSGREHVVLIRSADGSPVMHTLFYPDELRSGNRARVSGKAASGKTELALATKLIHQLAAPFHPESFHDTYRENVKKLIEQKRKGQGITSISRPKRAPLIDLMEALKKSIKTSVPSGSKPKRRGKAA
jgi:DNA end-binding protein Ku